MKYKINMLFSFLIFIIVIPLIGEASSRGRAIISEIESGTYVQEDIISAEKLRWLPIPAGTADYAFYQSIHMISNVVLGNFKVGDLTITLIQDINADGRVDVVVHWFKENNKLVRENEPAKFCTDENFRKLKELIINGRSETISLGGKDIILSPNREARSEFENLAKISANVAKYKQGLRIKKLDPDEETSEMAVYTYSYNIEDNTADLIFNVKYFYRGNSRISPVINYGVYCLRSEDPFVIETVKQLRDIIGKSLSDK